MSEIERDRWCTWRRESVCYFIITREGEKVVPESTTSPEVELVDHVKMDYGVGGQTLVVVGRCESYRANFVFHKKIQEPRFIFIFIFRRYGHFLGFY